MSRLTPERTDELYAEVLRLLTELGYDRLTMDRIAEATRSSKATLYRQWGSKESLVVAAFDAHAPEIPEVVDTGSFRDDMLALYQALPPEEDKDIALAGAVLHACGAHPTLAESLHERIITTRLGVVDEVLARAIARGEVAPDNRAIPFLVSLLLGPGIVRQLIERRPPDLDFHTQLLDAVVLPALGITPTAP